MSWGDNLRRATSDEEVAKDPRPWHENPKGWWYR